jgi:hypothetical protein
MRALILQQVLVGLDVHTTIEHCHLDVREVGAEPLKLMADLQHTSSGPLKPLYSLSYQPVF